MKSTEILNSLQVSLTINRLCSQLIENHHDFSESVLIGLQPNGIFLSNRLKNCLENSINNKVQTGSLDITFFRDDFGRKDKPLIPSVTNIDFSIENKKVILIDDVFFTGFSCRDTLSLEEIIQATLNEQDMNTQLKNYNNAARLFPNDWRIMNNTGYIMYMMGDNDGASKSFENALSITDNNVVSNNVAAVKHVLTGKSTDEIKSLLESSNTTQSKYNIGLIQIEEGKYEESITSMGDSKSYNYALANILAEHYDAASDAIDDLDFKDAKSFYLKAIIGARTSNTEVVMENLKLAFEKDASLKDMAKKDREFIKFFENSDFLAIF